MTGEKLKLCRLYEKQSSRGNTYFVGRLGGARVVMMRDERAEVSDGTVAVWELMLSPADEAPPRRAPSAPAPRTRTPRPVADESGLNDPLPWVP